MNEIRGNMKESWRNMLPSTWAAGLVKIWGPPQGGSGSVTSLGESSQFPGLGSTPEKKHETSQEFFKTKN